MARPIRVEFPGALCRMMPRLDCPDDCSHMKVAERGQWKHLARHLADEPILMCGILSPWTMWFRLNPTNGDLK
jgi:hypothetical protein